MKQYVYLIRPVRDHFMTTMTEEESAIMGRHFQYLQDRLANNELILAGPCTDGAFGIVVFEEESEEAAQRYMESDPAVQTGVMKAELHPFKASLLQSGKKS